MTSSLSDTLPSMVPKLNSEGDNWVIFLVCFMDVVEAKGFWGHFDGMSLTRCCLYLVMGKGFRNPGGMQVWVPRVWVRVWI